MAEIERSGGCLCGAVRFKVRGQPLRSGLCHCLDCRKASGSHFSAFAVWPADAFESTGEMKVFAQRSFCPQCGSRLAWLHEDEAEITLGSLDVAPGDIFPDYELWVGRREAWLTALPWAEQFDRDRVAPEPPVDDRLPPKAEQPI